MTDPLATLAEPRRREILLLVWDRELPAGEIARAFEVTFSAISQHLTMLHRHGLVCRRREGRRRLYRADREALGPLASYMETLWRERLRSLGALAEEDDRR